MADEEPSKYRMTFRDRSGKEEVQTVVQVPDPGDAEKVKEQQLKDRSDLRLRGVTADSMTVTKIGPLTPADLARVSGALGSVTKVAASK